MKNKLRMGFEYEITHISPEGKTLEKQKVHNIMINEGITNFLKCVFIKQVNSNSADWESRCSAFTYAFMESEYEPQPTDKLFNGNNAFDLYGVDYNNTLLSQGKYYKYYTLMTSDIKLGKDNISIIIGEGYYKFTGYKTLTGVCLFRNNFSNQTNKVGAFSISSLNSLLKGCVLISAAKFKTPIQVNPGGTIRAKSNFIVLPA